LLTLPLHLPIGSPPPLHGNSRRDRVPVHVHRTETGSLLSFVPFVAASPSHPCMPTVLSSTPAGRPGKSPRSFPVSCWWVELEPPSPSSSCRLPRHPRAAPSAIIDSQSSHSLGSFSASHSRQINNCRCSRPVPRWCRRKSAASRSKPGGGSLSSAPRHGWPGPIGRSGF
jgi:hypothetical protein